jgi:hypothetical protein
MTKIPSVEEYSKAYEERSFERMSELAMRLVERNETQRLALLTELRDSGLLEEKEDVSIIKNSPQWVKNLGHNTLARNIKAHLDELIKSNNP